MYFPLIELLNILKFTLNRLTSRKTLASVYFILSIKKCV